jgi:Putative DNA-binding domain
VNGLPPASSNCPHPVHAEKQTARDPVPMMEVTAQVTRGSLEAFQEDFARALLASEADPDAGSSVAALARQPGFAVYRNTVLKGCIDALQANYPAVARLVGEQWFRAAATVYARANLPAQAMLLHYGEGFAQFLAAFEPAAQLPYLPGVARLDRFWTEAHMARDETPVDPNALAVFDAAQMQGVVLRPHATARWAWFDRQPIYTIWQRNRAAGPIDETEIEWRGEGALLVRPRDAVQWVGIDAAGCAFLDACAAGCALAEAGAAALAASTDADLTALGAQLFAIGAFGHASLGDAPIEESRI